MRAAGESGWSDLRDWRWKALAVGLKLALYLFLIVAANRSGQVRMAMNPVIGDDPAATGFLFFQHSRDEWSYLNPIENLLAHGEYVVDRAQPETRADRMPAYGFTYLVFRLFAPPNAAKTCLVLLQTVVSGLSLYYLSLLAWLVFRRRLIFYLVFAAYGLSVFVSVFDPVLFTESLAASSLIFFLYGVIRFRETERRRLLLVAGFFFAYMVFLRPFLAPLALLAAPACWRGRRVVNAVVFLLPLVLFEGGWIVRNAYALHRFVPLQGSLKPVGYVENEAEPAVQRWLQAVGEDKDWWTPHNLAGWLRKDSLFHDESYRVAPYVLTPHYGMAELLAARELYNQGLVETDPQRKAAVSHEAALRFEAFRRWFIADKPLTYRLYAPLRLTRTFFATTGPALPFRALAELKHDLPALGFKLLQVALYWLILLSAVGGLVLLVRAPTVDGWILAAPLLFVTLLFPMVLRTIQLRMLVCAYPSLCVLAALFWTSVVERLRPAAEEGAR